MFGQASAEGHGSVRISPTQAAAGAAENADSRGQRHAPIVQAALDLAGVAARSLAGRAGSGAGLFRGRQRAPRGQPRSICVHRFSRFNQRPTIRDTEISHPPETCLVRRIRMDSMTTTSISQLKANLSRYIDEVRRGGEVQIVDRGMPVARLVPATAGDDPKALERIVNRGLIRRGKGDPTAVLKEPPLDLPVSILDALHEDRDDRL